MVLFTERQTRNEILPLPIKEACMAFGQCQQTFGKTEWIHTTVFRLTLSYECLVWWLICELIDYHLRLVQ